MENTINPAVGIIDILIDAINKKYDNIRDLNSLNVNLSEESYESMIPVIDSIIENENNSIGRLQQLIDFLGGSEEDIEEGKQETIEIIDTNEFVESITTMKKKLRLSENFDNVIDDVQAVADPVFVGANEEHDENKKKYEDAMGENKDAAEDTIPEEGETGKEVKSAALKAMHLSEELFEDLSFDAYDDFNHEVYNAIADVCYKFSDRGLSKKDIEAALEWFEIHFEDDDFEFETKEEEEIVEESLNESFVAEWWGQVDGDTPQEVAERYNLKVKPIKKNLDEILYKFEGKLEDFSKAMDDGYFYALTVQQDAGHSEDIDSLLYESIQTKIAKEQIKRFTEGKMPKDWSVEKFLEKLTEKKHINNREATMLREWYSKLK